MQKLIFFSLLAPLLIGGCTRIVEGSDTDLVRKYALTNQTNESAQVRFIKTQAEKDSALLVDSALVIAPGDTLLICTTTINGPFANQYGYIDLGSFDSASVTFASLPTRTFRMDLANPSVANPSTANLLRDNDYRQVNEVKQGNSFIYNHLFIIQ